MPAMSYPDRSSHGGPNRSGGAASTQLKHFVRRIALLGAIVAGLLILATLALAASEDVSLWYAFRWSLDTAATVGGFPRPHTTFAQIVEVGLVLVGVGTLFYALATVTEFFGAGHLGEVLTARRRLKMIDSLTGHYISCGFRRVARQVASALY